MGSFFSDPLRLTLAAVAIVILVGLVVFGRKGASRHREHDVDLPAEEEVEHSLNQHFTNDEYVGPVRTVGKVRDGKGTDKSGLEQPSEKKPSIKKEDIRDDQFVVLNLVPKAGEVFTGSDLLQVFRESGLEYGEFKIFHFPHRKDRDQMLFSVVNMVKPGFFDMGSMDSFSTTGLSMFMRLPVYGGDNEGTFSNMLATAHVMARKLRANIEVQDRTPITEEKVKQIKQYLAHYTKMAKQPKPSKQDSTETV